MSQVQTAEPLSFRVRAGLVVHRTRLVRRNEGGGRTVKSQQTDSFYGVVPTQEQPAGCTVDLLPDEVRLHAHALEPTDERGAAALAALHHRPPVKAPDPQELAQSEQLKTQITAGVMAELLRLGVLQIRQPKAS